MEESPQEKINRHRELKIKGVNDPGRRDAAFNLFGFGVKTIITAGGVGTLVTSCTPQEVVQTRMVENAVATSAAMTGGEFSGLMSEIPAAVKNSAVKLQFNLYNGDPQASTATLISRDTELGIYYFLSSAHASTGFNKDDTWSIGVSQPHKNVNTTLKVNELGISTLYIDGVDGNDDYAIVALRTNDVVDIPEFGSQNINPNWVANGNEMLYAISFPANVPDHNGVAPAKFILSPYLGGSYNKDGILQANSPVSYGASGSLVVTSDGMAIGIMAEGTNKTLYIDKLGDNIPQLIQESRNQVLYENEN